MWNLSLSLEVGDGVLRIAMGVLHMGGLSNFSNTHKHRFPLIFAFNLTHAILHCSFEARTTLYGNYTHIRETSRTYIHTYIQTNKQNIHTYMYIYTNIYNI